MILNILRCWACYKMFSMTWHNILMMLIGVKLQTLRSTSTNFKIGSTQLIKVGMFDAFAYMKIKITNAETVNINELTQTDFQQLGYTSKADYMKEPFNINNSDPLRIRYTFEIIATQPELLAGILEAIEEAEQ